VTDYSSKLCNNVSVIDYYKFVIGIATGSADASPRARVPSKFARFAGFRSCCYTNFAPKMH